MRKLQRVEDLAELRERVRDRRTRIQRAVSVCLGTGCRAYHPGSILEAFRREITRHGLDPDVVVRGTGCHGFCERGPMAVVLPERICYLQIREEDVPEIVEQTLVKHIVVERLLFKDDQTQKRIATQQDIPFYSKQHRVLLDDNLLMDPKSIEDYIATGGYGALEKVLFKMRPEEVLQEIKNSQLRGRGGAGFLTGLKWETARNAPGRIKYVIVNADEGDPGAYMDQGILEGNPHSVLEGLMIGAYAIGSRQGFVFVRQEYPQATEHIRLAIETARSYGLLGRKILGSSFGFDVMIHRGAGAFVSGESSALMSAIEGCIGEPRPKYVRTAVKGVWDRPSNLNNVETWANVPRIINRGADWFASMGTEGSRGTKIFSLVGKVQYTGLVEVPMGMTLRQIIFDIGGGIRNGKAFKAVQTGGPSGGCIPDRFLDLPVDFDALTRVGSMMGSGGMIVMDEDTCMVDVAKYFTRFLADESCGKCIPCREGLRQMNRILTRIASGKGEEGDLLLLEELGEFMKDASLCALGSTAPNPLLSTLRFFQSEYIAHIGGKRCPAKVCLELVAFSIDPEKCSACGLCAKQCPTGAIAGGQNVAHRIQQEKCIKCGACLEACPKRFNAVAKVDRVSIPVQGPQRMSERERAEQG